MCLVYHSIKKFELFKKSLFLWQIGAVIESMYMKMHVC